MSKLGPQQRVQAEDIIERISNDEDAMRDFVYRAIGALEMLNEQNVPRKYVKQGGVVYCLYGSSSISAYEALERSTCARRHR